MADDRYDDEPDDQHEAVKGEDAGDTDTALLPKSVLRGYKCEVGDKLVMRVNGIYDDEVAVTVESEQKGGEAEAASNEDEGETVEEAPDASDAALVEDATSAAPANDMYA